MAFASPPEHGPAAFDPLELRRAFGHFATGVTVVTYQAAGGEFRGTTVNSFTSVSLDPPLVLVSLGRQSRAAATLRSGSAFAVNVLHHGQRDLAMHFAGRPKPETAVSWTVREGVPHLAGCSSYFRCTAQEVHGAGDHLIVVARVEEFRAELQPPLIFYRGAFERLDNPDAAQPAPEVASHLFGDFPELW